MVSCRMHTAPRMWMGKNAVRTNHMRVKRVTRVARVCEMAGSGF